MGADRAVLVSDPAAAGSDLVATSHALATALAREEVDLVLFGQQSSDADGAVLWAAVADRLRRPMVSQVAELTVDGATLTGKRQTEFGYDVISQETVSLADAGIEADRVGEAGSKTTVRAVAPPPAKSDQVRIEDDGSAAEKIVEYLAEKRLI
jgi:electron transfer flavoprotein beta subunit